MSRNYFNNVFIIYIFTNDYVIKVLIFIYNIYVYIYIYSCWFYELFNTGSQPQLKWCFQPQASSEARCGSHKVGKLAKAAERGTVSANLGRNLLSGGVEWGRWDIRKMLVFLVVLVFVYMGNSLGWWCLTIIVKEQNMDGNWLRLFWVLNVVGCMHWYKFNM